MFNGLQFVVIMLSIALKLFSRSLANTCTMATAFVRAFNSPRFFSLSTLCSRKTRIAHLPSKREVHEFFLRLYYLTEYRKFWPIYRRKLALMSVTEQLCISDILSYLKETIHPGTKEGTPHKGQEPNPTHRRSEGPYHNLEKTRGNNIELHQCSINRRQAERQKNRQKRGI